MGTIVEHAQNEQKDHGEQTIAEGKYRLLALLGEGGMGAVWKAEQVGMGGFAKTVALKLIFGLEDNRESHRSFLNEARLSARLHHPNIVEIYDLGRDGDVDYIAMECIEGQDLEQLLRQRASQNAKGLPWELAVRILIDACKGLHYAHNKKDTDGSSLRLVHRDLKPSNILISTDGFVKIIDFGIARSTINEGKTKTGVVKGTPAYMSPEQLNDQSLDARCDVYALGAILYELCCGKPAFEGDSLFSILYAIQTRQPTPPTRFVDSLPERVETIILRCLNKDREMRYQDARSLQRALEGVLQEHSVFMDHEELALQIESLQAGAVTQGAMPSALPGLAAGVLPEARGQTPAGGVVVEEILPGRLTSSEELRVALSPTGLLFTSEYGEEEKNPPSLDSVELSLPEPAPPTFEMSEDPGRFEEVEEARDGLLPSVEGPSDDGLVVVAQVVPMSLEHNAPKSPASEDAAMSVAEAKWPKAAALGAVLLLCGLAVAFVVKRGFGQARDAKSTSLQKPASRAPKTRMSSPRATRAVASPVALRPRVRTLRSVVAQPLPLMAMAKRTRPRKVRRRKMRSHVARRTKRKSHAILRVELQPRCQLTHQGRFLGIADGAPLKLKPGRYRFRCLQRRQHFVHHFQLNLEPGKKYAYRRTFRQGRLFVISFPYSVLSLQREGVPLGRIGRSHDQIKLFQGKYKLTLYKLGRVDQQKEMTISIKSGQLLRPKVIW